MLGTSLRTAGNALRDTQEGIFSWIPISVAINGEQTVLHNNLGLHYNRFSDRASRARFTWGICIEHWIGERMQVVGETFGESHRESPLYQGGLRGWIVPERVQVDATFGNEFGGASADRWISVGLRLLTAEIL